MRPPWGVGGSRAVPFSRQARQVFPHPSPRFEVLGTPDPTLRARLEKNGPFAGSTIRYWPDSRMTPPRNDISSLEKQEKALRQPSRTSSLRSAAVCRRRPASRASAITELRFTYLARAVLFARFRESEGNILWSGASRIQPGIVSIKTHHSHAGISEVSSVAGPGCDLPVELLRR